jgi:ribosomal protein L37AE/L43A
MCGPAVALIMRHAPDHYTCPVCDATAKWLVFVRPVPAPDGRDEMWDLYCCTLCGEEIV